MADNENLPAGEELSLDMVVAHGYFFWLQTRNSRWHVKFGLAWADFESTIPSLGTASDQGLGLSIGTGFEWGSPRFALFVDFGVTVVDIELIEGEEEGLVVGNTLTGLIVKF